MTGARLLLTRPTPGDRADYGRLLLRHEVAKWHRPPPLPPLDPGGVARLLNGDLAHWDEHGFGPWVLRRRDGGAFVGRGGLRRTEVDGEPTVEVLWAILPELWRNGLATECARAAIDHARELALAKVVAFTLPTNAASERVMQKAGLERVGAIEHAGLAHVLYRLPLRP